MNKRNLIIGGIIVVLVIVGLVVYGKFQDMMTFPTSTEAGVSFQTIQSSLPENSGCLNEAGEAGLAKELINMGEGLVVVGAGDTIMPDDVWADYSPKLPWQKNTNRNTMFNDSCFYRSPSAPADCQGEECQMELEVDGYSWVELSIINAQDCLPSADAGCAALSVEPGAIDIKVISKCHQIIYEDEIYELADPAGNRYVMHATDTGTPDLNAAIPDGWTLAKVTLDEPLEILPFGGGDACYHNVLRDNLNQGYHQYIFAEETYP
ncbi:MAG: hypothetical protein GY755_07560 [Chloroflexi bacterium]|nr:hypothetical protein [Chloroflexota bacterium]